MPDALPPVEIWKRAQRLAEEARTFALLWDGARTSTGPDRRQRFLATKGLGEQLRAELAAMIVLLDTATAHPPPPKTAPARDFSEPRTE